MNILGIGILTWITFLPILGMIAILAIIGFIGYIFKVAIKTIIVISLLYVLFNAGFIWTGSNLEGLDLEKYIGKTAATQIETFYDKFKEKREASDWIDTQKLKEMAEEKAKELAKEKLKEVEGILEKSETK